MRILIISYFFAPVGGVATERIRKFAKYLPEFGWEPIILTQTVKTYQLLKPREIDETVSLELPKNLMIHRTSSPVLVPPQPISKKAGFIINLKEQLQSLVRRITGLLLIPDPQILWLKTAITKGRQIIKTDNVNLIFATGPSFTPFVVGALLNKITGCPLILDYRDPWALNSIFFPGSPVRRFMIRHIERWCLSRTSAALFATEGFKKLYTDKYPSLKKCCHVISNGYDGDVMEYQPRTKISPEEPIVIGYAGKMFGDQYPVSELFQAVEAFLNQTGRPLIELRMAGEISTENKITLEQLAISNAVKLQGYLHKSEVDAMLSECDILLMIIGDTHPFLFGLESAKLFEYLRFNRPILALVPKDGAVWQFIDNNNSGLLCSPSNIDEIIQTLHTLNQMTRSSENMTVHKRINKKSIDCYHRRALTLKLANLCSSVIKRA